MDFLPLENVEEFDELIEVRAEATKGNPRLSSGNGKEIAVQYFVKNEF